MTTWDRVRNQPRTGAVRVSVPLEEQGPNPGTMMN